MASVVYFDVWQYKHVLYMYLLLPSLFFGSYCLCLEEIKLNRTGHFQGLQFGLGVCPLEWNSF